MCTVCGCAPGAASVEHDASGHHHHHDGHGPAHRHGADGALDYGSGPAGVHVAGVPQKRLVEIETDILAKNNRLADRNRARLEAMGALALNLVSSPGSGKTTLLVETIRRLGADGLAVIEGDQQTDNDARRIRQTGAPAIQVNTGKGCHLDASMVEHAMDHLQLADRCVLFIENVGNLVCPAGFDLGEEAKVVVLSVTEGEDKPLKYPHMFAAASLMLLNKIDLAPHVDFDMDRCEANARRINPQIEVIRISARSGEGMDGWLGWIAARRESLRQRAIAAATARLSGLANPLPGTQPA
jgi:hydrogenase nickel incorporation protein HypB